MLEQLTESTLFSALAPHVDDSIDKLFDGNVQERKYVIDATRCRSLGSLLVSAGSANIAIDNFRKTRFSFKDRTRQEYNLPVTDLRVADGQADRITEIVRRIAHARERMSQILLRIGLARGFDGSGRWNQKRCYLQVNGVFFPS